MPPQVPPVAQLEAALATLKMPQRASESSHYDIDANANDPEMVDLVLQHMPKSGDLSTTDNLNDLRLSYIKEKEIKFVREMALPPKRVGLVNRADLVETLRITEAQTDEFKRLAASGKRAGGEVEIGVRQRFSLERLENLKRISTSELLIRKIHEGRYLLCRTICPIAYDAGIAILLATEDPLGDTVYVKLYNHPLLLEVAWSEVVRVIVPIGTILAIREPMYVGGAFSGPSEMPFIKVDSPSDVVFVDVGHPILHNISWKRKLDVFPHLSRPPVTGEAWKAFGAKEFKNGQWFSSAFCYTKCIEAGYDVQIAHLNRSEVYLRLGWNNSAFHDAKTAFDSGALNDDLKKKAVIRMVKARYALGQYDAVLEIVRSRQEDEVAAEWATKATKRKEEQSTGKFDWAKLFREAKGAYYSPDIGDYTGPIEVGFREGPIKVRGTFASRDVKIGELLMFQKPISSYWHKGGNNLALNLHHIPSGRTCDRRLLYHHFTNVVQKIWDDKNAYTTIRALYGGGGPTQPIEFPPPLEMNSLVLEHPTRPVVDIDIDYVFTTVTTNSFECGTLFPSLAIPEDGSVKDETGYGLYAAASLMNHSCMPSAHREFIGDAIFVRANRDIKKGEEVTIAYLLSSCYDERQFRLMRSWGFKCTCELCEADSLDDEDTRKRRFELVLAMKDIFDKVHVEVGSGALRRLEANAKKYCEELRGSYSGARGRNAIRPELAEATRYFATVAKALANVDPNPVRCFERAIELRMDSLDIEGYHVNDRSVSGPIAGGRGGKGKETQLPLDLNSFTPYHMMCVVVVFQIVKIFDSLGEKKRAQRWFDVVLQMENLYLGGGKALFKIMQEEQLNFFDLWKYM